MIGEIKQIFLMLSEDGSGNAIIIILTAIVLYFAVTLISKGIDYGLDAAKIKKSIDLKEEAQARERMQSMERELRKKEAKLLAAELRLEMLESTVENNQKSVDAVMQRLDLILDEIKKN